MSHILTNKGLYFPFDRPDQHPYTVEEIAHALSHICRFTGHVDRFYSVAQHSVLVSLLVPPEFAMDALLHDASEAYLGDVASPLKRLLPEYKAIEIAVEHALAKAFGLSYPLPPIVKWADTQMLVVERRDFLPTLDRVTAEEIRVHRDGPVWPVGDIYHEPIEPLLPVAARTLFMRRYNEIKEAMNAVPA